MQCAKRRPVDSFLNHPVLGLGLRSSSSDYVCNDWIPSTTIASRRRSVLTDDRNHKSDTRGSGVSPAGDDGRKGGYKPGMMGLNKKESVADSAKLRNTGASPPVHPTNWNMTRPVTTSLTR